MLVTRVLVCVSFVLGACGDPLPEPYLVQDLRVIAVVLEPPQAEPGQTVQVTAYLADPGNDGRAVQARLATCPWRGGEGGTSDCVADGRELIVAEAVAQAVGAELFVASFPYTVPGDILEGRSVIAQTYGFFEYLLVHGDNGLRVIDAHKRLVVTAPPTSNEPARPRNHNPALLGFTVTDSGTVVADDQSLTPLEAERTYDLSPVYDPASLEQYQLVDYQQQPLTFDEEASFVWSCTPRCGLDRRVSFGLDTVSLSVPKELDSLTVHVVMRDGRGGGSVDFARFVVLPGAEARR